MPCVNNRIIGVHSVLTTLAFLGVVAAFQLLDIRNTYFGCETALYGSYNLLKILLFVMLFLICAGAGTALLRLIFRLDVGATPSTKPLLLVVCMGMFTIHLLTWALGWLGLMSWQVLLPAMAVFLLVSDSPIRTCTRAMVRWGTGQVRMTIALVRNASMLRGSPPPSGALTRITTVLLRLAFAYQYAVFFLIFALRPNDQINDVHVGYLPCLESFLAAKSTLVVQYHFYFQSLIKGVGFNLFVTTLGDPYFWQLGTFFHYTVALLCFGLLLRVLLPGNRLFRLAVLIYFSSTILFKFNQFSMHAIHTYAVLVLVYLFVAAASNTQVELRRAYWLVASAAIFGTLIIEPKLAFFVSAVVCADALWRQPEERLLGRRNLKSVGLIAGAILCVFTINYIHTGFIDMQTLPLWKLNNTEKVANWLGMDQLFLHELRMRGEFASQNFSLEGLKHGASRLYGGLEFLTAHLLCLAYVIKCPQRFPAPVRYLLLLCSSLMLTGLGLAWWQSNEGIIRFLYLLEPISLLIKAFIFCVILGLVPRKYRAWLALVASLLTVLTLKPTQSLVSPAWLTHKTSQEERGSLMIKNYAYKTYDLKKLSQFFIHGSFLSAHTDGFFSPEEPYACSKLMTPGDMAIVLNFTPAAHAVPGGMFLSELHTMVSHDFNRYAYASAQKAYRYLRTTRMQYLYLDASDPVFKITVLIEADLFSPRNISKFYEVVRRGTNTYLLRLKQSPSDVYDPAFAVFYERFYHLARNTKGQDLFDKVKQHTEKK